MKSKDQAILYLEVMQNGFVIAKTSCALGRSKNIRIGPYMGASLKLPFYPLSKNFEFLHIGKKA
jgi:hypothetical protein